MIYVVGKLPNQPMDDEVIVHTSIKLIELGYTYLGERLECGDYDVFDMQTYPEKGDFMDELERRPHGVELVVALHLFGIHMTPGNPMDIGDGYYYNRRNGYMLRDTLAAGGMLVAWGDQPWLAGVPFEKIQLRDDQPWLAGVPFEKIQLRDECQLFLYRRKQ